MNEPELDSALRRTINRLAKWRVVFAGWQLGTRPKTDPECRAVSDMQERSILLRCEVNALAGILLAKGVFSKEEWMQQLIKEADALSKLYEEKFPGFKAVDTGMDVNIEKARETMKDWKP